MCTFGRDTRALSPLVGVQIRRRARSDNKIACTGSPKRRQQPQQLVLHWTMADPRGQVVFRNGNHCNSAEGNAGQRTMQKPSSIGTDVLGGQIAKLVGLRLTDEEVVAVATHGPVTLSKSALAITVERICDTLEAHGVFVEGLFRLCSELGAPEALYKLLTVRPDVVDERVMLAAGVVTVASTLSRLLNSAESAILEINTDPMTPAHVLSRVVDPLTRRILHRIALMMHALSVAPATKVR